MNRILHIVGRMDRAGAETMVMNLYREIDRSRFQFEFVYFTTDRCDYDEEIQVLGGRIYRIAQANPISRFHALYRLLRNGDWKTVHSHTLFSSGLHLFAAKLVGVPRRIAHSHSTQDANSTSMVGRFYQRVSRRLISWAANRFVACGRAAAEYLFPGRKDVTLIPNVVDIDRFASASGDEVRAAFGIPDDHLVIVQVGRFMPVKNHVRSVEIARELRRAGVDFRMLMVGDGPERPGIESMVQRYALDGSVLFLGMRTDIPELMAAADVMLMPSFHEGFPVVLVEAQAAGLPSVVSSAVSPEVELGMDMVRFVGLDAPDGEWAEALQGAAVCAIPAGYTRRVVLRTAGFSAASGARRLEEIYEVA